MAVFYYIATDAKNSTKSGVLESIDRNGALAALARQNLKPISIKEGDGKKGSFSIGDFFGKNKIKSDDLVLFTRQLSAMVSAGVPILRALASLHDHAEQKNLQVVIQGVIKDVESGSTLADALVKYPNAFNDVYVNMVRAGEAAGILDDILKRLALQQEKNASIRKKVKSAMSYPVVLMGITILAFFGLMIFVIPQIGKIVKDLGGPDAQLPMLTQIMLSVSGFMTTNIWWLIPALVVGVIFFLRYLKTPAGKKKFDSFVLIIPGVKNIIIKLAIARFARTFSALMGAGVAVIEALTVTAHAVGNGTYEQALLDAADEVKNGKSLSSVIEKNPLFPPIVAQMLAVGEETGQTDTVLIKVADFYEEEVDTAIEGISAIIEPVMIVVMGGMVGLIAASVMLPIANMSQTIKN